MFRKAQLKLFVIITSILLAIFIAVLASINIVTKNFMQRQSREVLRQIATGIEYDEKTDTFTFTPPDGFEPKHIEYPLQEKKVDNIIPTEPQPEETTTDTITTSTTMTDTTTITTTDITDTTAEEVTTESATDIPETSEQIFTEIQDTPEPDTEPEIQTVQETETPTETETDSPKEVSTEIPPQSEYIPPPQEWDFPDKPDDFPPDNAHSPEDFPPDDRKDFGHWWRPDDWNYRRDDFSPQSYNDENYSVVMLGNTVTTRPEKKPDKNMFNHKKEEPLPKSFGSIEFFVIMADGNGNYIACMNNEDLTSENAQEYITEVISQKNNTGMMQSYQFYSVKKNNGTLIALTDKSEEQKVMKQFIRTTIIIGALTLVVLSFAGYFLSKKSIEPIKSAFEKQKQFISDASHELKTPLTVISANADVLSGEIGENKWLNYIKSQTERMNLLVNDLLSLTRLENNTSNFICTDFSLSQAVINTALPFECRAFETNKKFIVDVEDGLTVNGSEQHIKQMTAIFIDNALKYSDEGGTVKVSLRKQGDKKVLSVYNTGTGVKENEKDKIFERFYRSDDSRTRMATGGYGLGLAIAKSIIDKHRFKISVDNVEEKSISFIITM